MSKPTKRKANSEAPKVKKKQKLSGASTTAVSKTPVVSGDALKWKTVELPGRLEDAEGFFGLEEIEDVEIVKDDQNRHVMFRPKSGAAVQRVLDDEAPGDEWGGFDDVEVEAEVINSAVPPPAKAKKQKATDAARRQISKAGEVDKIDTRLNFDVLPDFVDDSKTDVSAWKDLDLSPITLSQLARQRFTKPTSIQAAAIPAIREGHDVVGKAVTGSGKTLAFGIPIFEAWLAAEHVPSNGVAKTKGPVLALILAPTRELALQLHQHLNELCMGLESFPRVTAVTGGLSIYKQQRQLEYADIVVATPGRLWEVMNDLPANQDSDALVDRLKKIKFLVVDEADRLLSEGHFKEVENILDTLDRKVVEEDEDEEAEQEKVPLSQRQTLVFSATFHKGLQQKLSAKVRPGSSTNKDLLNNQQSMDYLLRKLSFREAKPTFIDVNPRSQMASALSESIVECAAMKKDLYLYTLLMQNTAAKTLVFTNSISAVRRLTTLLQTLKQPAVGLHSTMPQKSRLRSLEKFTAQRTVLVATDVAARGLDIKGIDLIIHYHVPRTADMYVHRSGRTARADTSGRSILLCSPDEVAGVTRLIIEVHKADKAPEIMEVDGRLVSSVTGRVDLAHKITNATLAREKTVSKDGWLRSAAEELGVDYDSEEFENQGQRDRRGRGGGTAKKEKDQAAIGKDKISQWRAQLDVLLKKRINLGVSERYLAGGKVDVDALLDDKTGAAFLQGR